MRHSGYFGVIYPNALTYSAKLLSVFPLLFQILLLNFSVIFASFLLFPLKIHELIQWLFPL